MKNWLQVVILMGGMAFLAQPLAYASAELGPSKTSLTIGDPVKKKCKKANKCTQPCKPSKCKKAA